MGVPAWSQFLLVPLLLGLASSAPERRLLGSRQYATYKRSFNAYSGVAASDEPRCPFSRRGSLCFDQDLVTCPWAGYQSTCTKPTVTFGTVSCTDTPAIDLAAVADTTNKLAVGATCTIACQQGYTLHGSASVSCERQRLSDCSWDGQSDWNGRTACCNTECEAYTAASNSCGVFVCPTLAMRAMP